MQEESSFFLPFPLPSFPMFCNREGLYLGMSLIGIAGFVCLFVCLFVLFCFPRNHRRGCVAKEHVKSRQFFYMYHFLC